MLQKEYKQRRDGCQRRSREGGEAAGGGGRARAREVAIGAVVADCNGAKGDVAALVHAGACALANFKTERLLVAEAGGEVEGAEGLAEGNFAWDVPRPCVDSLLRLVIVADDVGASAGKDAPLQRVVLDIRPAQSPACIHLKIGTWP